MTMSDILATFGQHLDFLYSSVIADALDTLGQRQCALSAALRPLRPEWKVFGRAVTLCAARATAMPEKPYALELECIDALKSGDVLVATTQGDYGSALWGELLSTAAQAHGAVGVVLDGLTRDAAKIIAMDFPVFATGFRPLDSKGRLDVVSYGQPIRMGDCLIRPGDYIFGDIDGVMVVPAEVADLVFTAAQRKAMDENGVREQLARGRSVREVFAEYRIL
jgi:regulator of RNase E activity RraA